jgi:hypothetical protein
MIFSGTEFLTQEGTTTITVKYNKEIFDFPYSNRSDVINKGSSPTEISTVAITMSEAAMTLLLDHIITNQPGILQMGTTTYQNVILNEGINIAAVSKDKKGRYNLALKFIVLNPTGSSPGVI